MDVSIYQEKTYDFPPCWQLVADVYASELGLTVNDFRTINSSVRAIATAFRIALQKAEHGFKQAAEPVDYAVVLMAKLPGHIPTHCGIYYQGKVLHATGDGAASYQDLASLGDAYGRIEYWVKA